MIAWPRFSIQAPVLRQDFPRRKGPCKSSPNREQTRLPEPKPFRVLLFVPTRSPFRIPFQTLHRDDGPNGAGLPCPNRRDASGNQTYLGTFDPVGCPRVFHGLLIFSDRDRDADPNLLSPTTWLRRLDRAIGLADREADRRCPSPIGLRLPADGPMGIPFAMPRMQIRTEVLGG